MSFSLDDNFKNQLAESFQKTYSLVLKAEKNDTGMKYVSLDRQLQLAQLTAKTINEHYYHYLPGMWLPHIGVDISSIKGGASDGAFVITIDIHSIHRYSCGLWN